jgi:ABC-type arginine transport system permease subunit
LVYLLMCPILFMALDLLAYRSVHGSVFVSSLGMLGIWRMFQYGISGESLQYLFMAVVRGLPQNIVLFLLVFYFARIIARMLSTLTRTNRPAPTSVAI